MKYYIMDVLSITSIVVSVSIALGLIIKECRPWKKLHTDCGTCCNLDIEVKTPTGMSASPSGTSATLPSIDKLAKFIEDKKQEAEKVIETFRRFSDPLITIPPTNKI